jgi:hypothetical protein
LLNLRNTKGETDELLMQVRSFIDKTRETGAILDSDKDRSLSQSLINYWANILYSAKKESPEVILTEFDLKQVPISHKDDNSNIFIQLTNLLGKKRLQDSYQESSTNEFEGNEPGSIILYSDNNQDLTNSKSLSKTRKHPLLAQLFGLRNGCASIKDFLIILVWTFLVSYIFTIGAIFLLDKSWRYERFQRSSLNSQGELAIGPLVRLVHLPIIDRLLE